MAELKQTELSMNNLALYSASQSISSLISDPQIMQDGYLENDAPGNVVNAYKYFSEEANLVEDVVDWGKATWYIAPEDPDLFLEIDAVK